VAEALAAMHWEVETDAEWSFYSRGGSRTGVDERMRFRRVLWRKKARGSFTRLEVMERNGMASFTSDDDAFLEKGQGSRQTIGL
jgi:hypothetical protein